MSVIQEPKVCAYRFAFSPEVQHRCHVAIRNILLDIPLPEAMLELRVAIIRQSTGLEMH
jgi:hypothetical protein